MDSINKLITKAQSGDKEAWNELIKIYDPRLLKYCRKWFKKTEDAEEAVQEILLLCYRKISQLKEPEKFEGWIFTIAMNKCNEISNKNKRKVLTISDSNTEDDVLSMLENFKDNDQYIYPESNLERKEQYITLLNLLNEIPKEQKVCFTLRIILNKSFKEIAEKTGVSVSTAKSRYLYAKKSMKKNILEYEKENNCKLHRGIALSPSILFKYLFANRGALSALGFLSGINGGIASVSLALAIALVTTIAVNAPSPEINNVISDNYTSTSSTSFTSSTLSTSYTETMEVVDNNKKRETLSTLNTNNTVSSSISTFNKEETYPSNQSEITSTVLIDNNTEKNSETKSDYHNTNTEEKNNIVTKKTTTNVINNKIVTEKTKEKRTFKSPTIGNKTNTTEPTFNINNPNVIPTSTEPYFVTSGRIYFEKPYSWKGANLYCHIYEAESSEQFFGWQSKKEKLTSQGSNIFYYDLSLIQKSENNNQRLESNLNYRIIFSDSYGNTTQDLVFDTNYLNRTVIITGVKYEYISTDTREYIGKWK